MKKVINIKLSQAYIICLLFMSAGISAYSETLPYVNFSIPTTRLCEDSLIVFTNLGNPANSYIWKISNTVVSRNFKCSVKNLLSGQYTVELIVDSMGISNSISKQLVLEMAPEIKTIAI